MRKLKSLILATGLTAMACSPNPNFMPISPIVENRVPSQLLSELSDSVNLYSTRLEKMISNLEITNSLSFTISVHLGARLNSLNTVRYFLDNYKSSLNPNVDDVTNNLRAMNIEDVARSFLATSSYSFYLNPLDPATKEGTLEWIDNALILGSYVR